jgi:hypothetical protein
MNLEQFKKLEAERTQGVITCRRFEEDVTKENLRWVEACSTVVPKLLAVVEALKAVRYCEICSDCHDIAIKSLAALERDE